MTRSLLSVIAAILVVSACTTTGRLTSTPDGLATSVERLLQPALEAELFSGIILVARGDDIVLHEPFGHTDWELRAPVTRASRFAIGSITKSMTEVVVELLIAEGRIDLDAPVEDFIDDFPRGPEGGIPTIRHLYTHRSGVPHRVTTDIEETQSLGTIDIVERVRLQGLRFEPGSDRLYSSAGYTVLARVIEIVEGKPYEDVLAERIFHPAEMRSATSETGRTLMHRRASPFVLGTVDGHIAPLNAPYKDLRFLTGAGSVYATAEDLLRYMRAMRAGVFGPELWEQAIDTDAATWQGWAGWTSGYEAYVDVLPTQDLTVIVLTNMRSMVTWQIRRSLHAQLLGEPVEPIELPPTPAPTFEPLASVTGSYDRNGSVVEIRLDDGRLFRGDNEIYPISGERYFTPASGSVVAFRRNAQGEVDAMLSPPDDERGAMPRIE